MYINTTLSPLNPHTTRLLTLTRTLIHLVDLLIHLDLNHTILPTTIIDIIQIHPLDPLR